MPLQFGQGTWGQGQMLREFQENPASRAQLRDAVQRLAQGLLNNPGLPPATPVLVAPPPRRDYTPFIIAGVATVLAAFIIAQGKK